MAKLYGLGVGPGDSELVTLKAVRLMKECDVIAIPGENPEESVAYKIALGACPEIADKEQLLVTTPMTKDKTILENGYKAAAEKIEALLKEGKDVALLTLGDPTIYSTYIYIHRIVKSDGFDTEIISGVPSFCAVSAKLGDSLVDRDQQLHVIPASYQIEESLELSGTKILMKAASKFGVVKEILVEKDSKAAMIENCGMPEERIYHSLDEFPDKASYYTIVTIKE
ncbi:MAG: precorrin-2 C(20)-methyltransferase [Eubacteriales bacterium]|nr:precorrin-2 C(20)-methyltransferase [Eubacteriales bacterium]